MGVTLPRLLRDREIGYYYFNAPETNRRGLDPQLWGLSPCVLIPPRFGKLVLRLRSIKYPESNQRSASMSAEIVNDLQLFIKGDERLLLYSCRFSARIESIIFGTKLAAS